MGLELDRDEYLDLVSEKRHKELVASINAMVVAINHSKNDRDFNIDLSPIAEKIPAIQFPQSEVKIDNNELAGKMDELKGILKELVTVLLDKPKKDWVFDIKRNKFGGIESVVAKQS